MDFITEMFNGLEGVSQETIDKARTLAEAYVAEEVKAKVEDEIKELDDKFEKAKDEHIDEMTTKLTQYVDTFIVEWAKENELAIDSGIKAELGAEFITTIKEALQDKGVIIPEADTDGALKDAEEENEKLKKELDESKAMLKEAKEIYTGMQKVAIVEAITKGLTATEKDRIKNIAEAFEFSSEDTYKSKVKSLVEAITGKKINEEDDKDNKDDGDKTKNENGENGEDDKKKNDDSKINESDNTINATLKFLRGQ